MNWTRYVFLCTATLCGAIWPNILRASSAEVRGAQSLPAEIQNIVSVETGKRDSASHLELGVVYDQHTLPAWGNAEADRAAKRILAESHYYQAVFLMGWGSANPEPSPGVYDWSSLDRRIGIILETGGIPVINLCCAPDWMRGGEPGKTDWVKLARTAPNSDRFGDFVDLVRKVAQRYPSVKYYQVWSELKGFWNKSERRWDYEGYTTLYNLVYSALKAQNPDIKVGGPYMTIVPRLVARRPSELKGPYGEIEQDSLDVIQYWLAHKKGADFIAVDGTSAPLDGGAPADVFANTQIFTDVDEWIRARTDLPIWWSEYYPVPNNHKNNLPIGDYGPDEQNALLTETLMRMAPAAVVALRWAPEGDAHEPVNGDQASVWSDTTQPGGGGQPFPFAVSMKEFSACFPRSEMLISTKVLGANLAVLAGTNCTLLVNEADTPVAIRLNGYVQTLKPYEVRFDHGLNQPVGPVKASPNQ